VKRDWTEGRQADVRLRSGGPLGALFSLEVKAGLKEESSCKTDRGEAYVRRSLGSSFLTGD
jgi:hypothetical protein